MFICHDSNQVILSPPYIIWKIIQMDPEADWSIKNWQILILILKTSILSHVVHAIIDKNGSLLDIPPTIILLHFPFSFPLTCHYGCSLPTRRWKDLSQSIGLNNKLLIWFSLQFEISLIYINWYIKSNLKFYYW